MAWENGAWFGSISEAEQKAGGAWIIGDKPHCSDPDFPGLVGVGCWPLVKIWFAYPGRYRDPNHPMTDRINKHLREYLRVLTGRLDCLVHFYGDPAKFRTCRLEYPAEGIDLHATNLRQLQLPDGVDLATGITICHQTLFVTAGLTNHFEFHFWDTGSLSSLLALDAPVNLREWNHQFIAPFHGGCFLSPGICSPNRPVLSGEYVFLRRQEREQWQVQPSFQARGVVIYF